MAPRTLSQAHLSSARRGLLAGLAVLAITVPAGGFAPVAQAANGNYSYPATYKGTAATGGTVELDVSADGLGISRFAVINVPMPPCPGLVNGVTTGTIPIVNGSFSYGDASGTQFSGTFPVAQQAQGTITARFPYPFACTSETVSWSATTTTPPPPPETSISSGPAGKRRSRRATFRFRSSEAGSTFQCKLDQRRWRSCRSPQTDRKLRNGRHIFEVRARNPVGDFDPSPAKRSWRVIPRR
jgi:hypothetical protein